MVSFFQRLIGVLALDASIFEEVEADRRAGAHAILVLIAAGCGGRIAAIAFGITRSGNFIAGVAIATGALLVWVSAVAVLGRYAFAQPQTKSSIPELLRTLAFASAPCIFLSFVAIAPAAPVVLAIVLAWTLMTTVIAVRQSLDYTSTGRAIAVCVLGALLSLGSVAAIVAMFGATVS